MSYPGYSRSGIPDAYASGSSPLRTVVYSVFVAACFFFVVRYPFWDPEDVKRAEDKVKADAVAGCRKIGMTVALIDLDFSPSDTVCKRADGTVAYAPNITFGEFADRLKLAWIR